MRLLHTTNISQHKFSDGDIPKYAILSHRWVENEEISLNDFKEGPLRDKSGWAKIQQSCKFAKSLNHDWIWIDTCCIDKSNSEELSEAIKSMYHWYRNAECCLTYLCDVSKDSDPSRIFKVKGSSKDSEWFRRGWTLQELLAPRQLRFYDMEWNYLGTRSQLVNELQTVTGIDIKYLQGGTTFRNACIATRMSWMANRTTKRKEDMAYSMLGIFNLTMPIVYGEDEREHAFERLQELLLGKHYDDSLFAWRIPHDFIGAQSQSWELDGWRRDEWGMLAPHPCCFAESQHFTVVGEEIGRAGRPGLAVTKDSIDLPQAPLIFKKRVAIPLWTIPGVMLGLVIAALIMRVLVEGESLNDIYPLNCWQRGEDGKLHRVQLYLRPGPGGYRRCRSTELRLDEVPRSIRNMMRYVKPKEVVGIYRTFGVKRLSIIVLQPQPA
ncbi:hypothetical protein PV11_02302 [Exophiala sideris]|uniref:Heterokaryon incompatibility domain-containing protein n=1 Tax=Exophiala sideris TaxID=1016849 RepID=A0A0D1YYV3_9EURO|nr:hypothetical protein PV11_02302 [Exophiala sideris]